MLAAWSQLDFETISNQAALVTNCTQLAVSYYLDDFKRVMLSISSTKTSGGTSNGSVQPNTAEARVKALAEFADAALEFSLANVPAHQSRDTEAKALLLKWGYITSQILKELVIKSSLHFGPFQVLSLFIQ